MRRRCGPRAAPARGRRRGAAPGVTARSSGGVAWSSYAGHDVARRGPVRAGPGAALARASRPRRRRRPRSRGRSGCAGRAPPPGASPSGCHSGSRVVGARAREPALARPVARRRRAARRSRCAPTSRRPWSRRATRPAARSCIPGVPVQRAHRAAVDRRHPDLAAVEVAARGEGVGHLGAVGRDRGLALVAVRVEVAVRGGEAPRPGVVAVHHGEPRRVVALDADHEPAVGRPHRARALDQLARRAAAGRGTSQTWPSSA